MIGAVQATTSILASLAFFGAVCLADDVPPEQTAEPTFVGEATVTRAVTGDSLDARVDGNRTALGLLGARARSPGEPCGPEALQRLGELAGARVQLTVDPAFELDDRGRRLFGAYTEDGTWIEEALIREGLAYADRADAVGGVHLAQVQAEAEANGVGCLWSGG